MRRAVSLLHRPEPARSSHLEPTRWNPVTHVLPGFTEFYWVLLGFYFGLPSFTGLYWVLPGFYFGKPGFPG